MGDTLNLLYVILVAIALLGSIIGFIIALFRNVDKNTSRIENIEGKFQEVKQEKLELKKEIELSRVQNDYKTESVLKEVKKSELVTTELLKVVTEMSVKLSLVLEGKLKIPN